MRTDVQNKFMFELEKMHASLYGDKNKSGNIKY